MNRDRLIDEFILCTEEQRNVDYGNSGSVRKFNNLSKKKYMIAKLINDKYPELIPGFVALLQHPDWDVKLACAIRLLVDINCEQRDKDCAVNTIKEYINTPDMPHTPNIGNAFEWRMRMRDLGLL